MQKETLTLDAIKKDLTIIIAQQYSNKSERWIFAICILIVLAVTVGILLHDVVPAILILLIGACYPLYRYTKERKKFTTQKMALLSACQRGDISISVQKFSHAAEEIIHEPHIHGDHTHAYKPIDVYYFENGASWRLPAVGIHYKWSKEFCLSEKGLHNISTKGSEFFFIRLQAHQEIAYIYPCLMFKLGENLKSSFP